MTRAQFFLTAIGAAAGAFALQTPPPTLVGTYQGFAGEDLEAPNRVGHRDGALRLGFTVTQTNTGHDARTEPDATFAADPQKLWITLSDPCT